MSMCLIWFSAPSYFHGRSHPFCGNVSLPDCKAIVAKRAPVRQSRRKQSKNVFLKTRKARKKAPETGAGKSLGEEKDCRNAVQTNRFAKGTKPLYRPQSASPVQGGAKRGSVVNRALRPSRGRTWEKPTIPQSASRQLPIHKGA